MKIAKDLKKMAKTVLFVVEQYVHSCAAALRLKNFCCDAVCGDRGAVESWSQARHKKGQKFFKFRQCQG